MTHTKLCAAALAASLASVSFGLVGCAAAVEDDEELSKLDDASEASPENPAGVIARLLVPNVTQHGPFYTGQSIEFDFGCPQGIEPSLTVKLVDRPPAWVNSGPDDYFHSRDIETTTRDGETVRHIKMSTLVAGTYQVKVECSVNESARGRYDGKLTTRRRIRGEQVHEVTVEKRPETPQTPRETFARVAHLVLATIRSPGADMAFNSGDAVELHGHCSGRSWLEGSWRIDTVVDAEGPILARFGTGNAVSESKFIHRDLPDGRYMARFRCTSKWMHGAGQDEVSVMFRVGPPLVQASRRDAAQHTRRLVSEGTPRRLIFRQSPQFRHRLHQPVVVVRPPDAEVAGPAAVQPEQLQQGPAAPPDARQPEQRSRQRRYAFVEPHDEIQAADPLAVQQMQQPQLPPAAGLPYRRQPAPPPGQPPAELRVRAEWIHPARSTTVAPSQPRAKPGQRVVRFGDEDDDALESYLSYFGTGSDV